MNGSASFSCTVMKDRRQLQRSFWQPHTCAQAWDAEQSGRVTLNAPACPLTVKLKVRPPDGATDRSLVAVLLATL